MPVFLVLSANLPNYLPDIASAEVISINENIQNQTLSAITIGAVSDLAHQLTESRNWSVTPSTAFAGQDIAWKTVQLLVVNSDTLTQDELQLAESAFYAGVPILIDGTSHQDENKQSKASTAIGGLGMSDPIVLLRYSGGMPEYQIFDITPDTPQFSPGNTTALNATLPAIAVDNINGCLDHWAVHSARARAAKTSRTSQPYRPIASMLVTFNMTNLSCEVGKEVRRFGAGNMEYEWTDRVDPCNQQMNVALSYTVDFFRSLPRSGDGTEGSTSSVDGKFVRITLDPKSGSGSGWRLGTEPTEKNTWFQSNANRTTWFGPTVLFYESMIESFDPDMQLLDNIPKNTPKNSHIKDVNSSTIGVAADFGLEVGDSGPKASGKLSVNYSSTSTRWVEYDVNEYTVENHSERTDTGPVAKWVWDRKYDLYNQFWRTRDYECSKTLNLTDDRPFWKRAEFTAASYSSFVPGMSTSFYVPSSKTGYSNLTISNTIAPVALSGMVVYAGLYQCYYSAGYSGYGYSGGTRTRLTKKLAVNWDAPVFTPEVPVRLEPFRIDSPDGLCLSVLPGEAEVVLLACKGENSLDQLWGWDDMNRYQSKYYPGWCLEVGRDNSVIIQSCDASARQKWRWEGDKLISELEGRGKRLTVFKGKPVVRKGGDNDIRSDWANYVRLPNAANAAEVGKHM
ncbi:hypothetical protein GCM10023116_26270 [Kistimonas scapharcae]|uniref:Ricin B lectin domain-containing protein n=1 Tax=Kistimonas scapharcae TaxID=1036133 RepID=A0ABP8V469_9GAMM